MSKQKITLIHGDCLEKMKYIEDKSIDMILCDLPYGTTKCKWDVVIPFDELWKQYNRIVKNNGVIALFGSQPFTSLLVCSNIKNYRYEIIWEKGRISNFMFVNKQIGKCHENIEIFYKHQPVYNPQMEIGEAYHRSAEENRKESIMNRTTKKTEINNNGTRFPRSVKKIKFHNNGLLHPTQKPVELLSYLINTYSNEGQIILDNCMGSCSTGIACLETGRNFIGIEKDDKYFDISVNRVKQYIDDNNLDVELVIEDKSIK